MSIPQVKAGEFHQRRRFPDITIDRIDEYGMPWFDYVLTDKDDPEWHSLTIMEDESWELLLPEEPNNGG